MKALVAIASFGTANDGYLARLIHEYYSMTSLNVHVTVLSNVPKTVPRGVEVIVGLPGKDPWSLPFGHKSLFADRLNEYDLFVYSEDDILVTERNIRAFLDLSPAMGANEILGFLRREISPDGEIYYPEVHGSEHWDPHSVRTVNQYTTAYFTNEHAACYILTRRQLERAICSGGFLVGPHRWKYDLLVTAATDPYTQCGFKKVICISHLEDFTVHHLSNKYAGRLGLAAAQFNEQIDTLLRIGRHGITPFTLFETQTKLAATRYSKHYYEPPNMEVLCLIPSGVRRVLSIGCGWGATEALLVEKGVRVTAVPLDPVISACAEARGVQVARGDFDTAQRILKGRTFDCLLLSNVLHLVTNPIEVLSSLSDLLSTDSTMLAVVPNLSQCSVIWRRIRRSEDVKDLGNYDKTGVHVTSRNILLKWFKHAGYTIDKVTYNFTDRARTAHHLTFGMVDQLLTSDFIVVARKRPNRSFEFQESH